jgi:NADH-quinone oxidoreductase subunit M
MASIILAAVLLKLGGYGLIKFLLPSFNFETNLAFQPIVLFISLIGVIYAGLCALRQVDLKRMIAFSSISHMSLAVAGIFTFSDSGIIGSIYLMVSHGVVSAAMFFLAGVLSDRYHTRSIDAFSGL